MPEGHTIHRHARLQRAVLQGATVRAWSPQGRFEEGAARLDGGVVEEIDAHGKHLFYFWTTGDVLHVHLGLFGRFRTFHDDPPDPTDGTRLALRVVGEDGAAPAGSTIYLSGATTVELISPPEVDQVVARLGPDPLRRDADPDRFVSALGRRTVPIAVALLDQKAIAGVGNVYRAELLFRAGIHPSVPAGEITEAQAKGLWADAVHLLALGERSGRILTVEPEDVGRSRRTDLRRGERLYVYKRAGHACHRCGSTIEMWEPRTRKVWACPSCQPR